MRDERLAATNKAKKRGEITGGKGGDGVGRWKVEEIRQKKERGDVSREIKGSENNKCSTTVFRGRRETERVGGEDERATEM